MTGQSLFLPFEALDDDLLYEHLGEREAGPGQKERLEGVAHVIRLIAGDVRSVWGLQKSSIRVALVLSAPKCR